MRGVTRGVRSRFSSETFEQRREDSETRARCRGAHAREHARGARTFEARERVIVSAGVVISVGLESLRVRESTDLFPVLRIQDL